jgi:carbon monoxide dehydrogenase subunit G
MLVLSVANPTLEQRIGNEISWRIDGAFSELPENIWYQEPSVAIGNVTNKVKIGAVAGNRKLEFGVRNVIEEVLQDKNYNIDHSASNRLEVDIVYLDVLKTQSSFSVIHNNKESIVIRLYGTIVDQNGKVIKKALVEESADETSMSTLLIDEGGKFNQQNLSTALKKACNSLVNKLLETK